MILLIALSMFATLGVTTAHPEEKPVHLCGRVLADARELACYGPRPVESRRKLSDVYDWLEWDIGLWQLHRALHPRWGPFRSGIVDECCLNPCTTAVLKQYC